MAVGGVRRAVLTATALTACVIIFVSFYAPDWRPTGYVSYECHIALPYAMAKTFLFLQNMKRFIVDAEKKLVYCFVAKTGTSFWKRVFNIIAGRNKGNLLFNISSRGIHRQRNPFEKFATTLNTMSFPRQYAFFQSATKFLFVRDPYERLYSGYIDRFFSVTDLLNVMSKRFSQFDVTSERPPRAKRPRRNGDETACHQHVNLTFVEFIQYVTESGPRRANMHFKPVHLLCLPCLLDYDFIGKMETFRDDTIAILTSAGIDPDDVFGDGSSFEENSDLNILHDVSARSFLMFRRYARCFTRFQILRRTWVTFQIRGYLSVKYTFPLSEREAETVTLDQFLELVYDAYRRSVPHDITKKQRHLAVVEAFSSVPRSLLQAVQAYVQTDCDLFGYECSVDLRFPPKPARKLVFNIGSL
ncbi:hypothetical protein BaRGS_00018026, partial [Batillaria attramentaria]